MKIGQVIKEHRKKSNISQGDFSKVCDISQTYLSLIENDQKEPKIGTLKVIAKYLKVPLPVLFFLSLDESDIPKRKQEVFKILEPAIKDMIGQIYIDD